MTGPETCGSEMLIRKVMDTKKLALKDVIALSQSSIRTGQSNPKIYEFFIDKPGKFDARSHTYYAYGWGVQNLHGMVYWRIDCTEELAGILESNFISAAPAGECQQGRRFLIHYRE